MDEEYKLCIAFEAGSWRSSPRGLALDFETYRPYPGPFTLLKPRDEQTKKNHLEIDVTVITTG